MSDNVASVIINLIKGIVLLGFVIAGIYALRNGFMKTGGFLIAASILGLSDGIKITLRDGEK